MKILWLDINSSYSHSSLAIPALDAQLDTITRELHQWRIAKATLKTDINSLIDEILEFRPEIILSTAWLFNHSYILNVAQRYKQMKPLCRIVLGGPEFLGDNLEYLKNHTYIEALFRGEGEELFPLFIKNIDNKDTCYSLPGFCHINEAGIYNDNGEAIVKEFATLNSPEKSSFFSWDKPFVQLETSRGCFNNCSFCISGNKRRVENIALDNIRKRIDNIAERGIKEIRILDRTFNADTERAFSMINIFMQYSPNIQFHLEVHPAFMSEKIKSVLIDIPANLLHVEAGIQSLSDEVLKACKRAGGALPALEGVEFLISTGRNIVHTDLIAGLPYYSFTQLVSDVKKLIKVNADEVQLELLKVLPGSNLRTNAEEYGLKYSKYPPYEVLDTPWISHKELSLVVYISKILDIFFNNTDWRTPFSQLVLQNDSFLTEFSTFFQSKGYTSHLSKERVGIILWNFCKERYSQWIPEITVEWLKQGLSFKKGPGASSLQWKFGDSTANPLFDDNTRENIYRYYTENNKRHWFSYNRKTNNSKSIGYFTEIM